MSQTTLERSFLASKRRSPSKLKPKAQPSSKKKRVAPPTSSSSQDPEVVSSQDTPAAASQTSSTSVELMPRRNKMIGFFDEGKGKQRDGEARAYAILRATHIVPEDFLTNSDYGPLSGISFEQRALSAYNDGLLEAKDRSATSEHVVLCTECGAQDGHTFLECALRCQH